MIIDTVRKLCEQNHTNFAEVERAVGLGNGVIGKWKDSSPRLETAKKVADHFGITVDDLLAENNTEELVR